MPLWTPPPLGARWQTNLTAGSRQGTNITTSATIHTKGAYADLIASVAKDSFGIYVMATGVGASAAATGYLLDVAVGAAGSEGIILPDLDVGFADDNQSQGKAWFWPLFIPSGSVLRARGQALVASDVAAIGVWLCQASNYPIDGGKVTAYGALAASSNGTSVTPGSGAFGAWTQIGATGAVKRARYWTCGYDGKADTTIVVANVLVEIGVGPNSTSVDSIGVFKFSQTAAELINGPYPSMPIARDVPDGETLWARIASAETEVRGVVIYGIS
jgi:hypothetical protein